MIATKVIFPLPGATVLWPSSLDLRHLSSQPSLVTTRPLLSTRHASLKAAAVASSRWAIYVLQVIVEIDVPRPIVDPPLHSGDTGQAQRELAWHAFLPDEYRRPIEPFGQHGYAASRCS